MQTLAILWDSCGATGLLAAAASVLAAVFLAIGIVSGARFSAWLAAALIATTATVLATIASRHVRGIEVDRSAEVAAAEAAGAQMVQEKLRGRAARVRFAEDTAADQVDVAGVTVAEEQGAYERAVAAELEQIPAYRREGPKERSGKKRADAMAASYDTTAEAAAGDGQADAESAQAAVRKLPEAQLRVADRFDRLNRGLAWSLLSLAVGLVGGEWVRRFNTSFDAVWPLPLSGTVIDGATAKAHVASPRAGQRLADYLATAVRKGESCIVFTEDDPLSGRDRLDRVAAGPLAWSLPVRTYASQQLASDPALAEIVFEAGWFGRGGFVVNDASAAGTVLAGFADSLDHRRHCRARARRTLNLVWALPTSPDATLVERLERLVAATNVRWVTGVWT